MNSQDVARLVEQQLATLPSTERDAMAPGLVEPFGVERAWDYPGQEYAAHYVCWTVWTGPSNVDIAYCEGGFGPRSPWGLVWRDPSASIGPDYSWFATLSAAFAES